MVKREATIRLIAPTVMLWVLFVDAGVWSLPARASSQTDTGQVRRLAELKKCDPNAVSLGLLPVQLQHGLSAVANRMVGDAIGLVAEAYGMNNLDELNPEFSPPANTPWEQAPAYLAEFLKQNPPDTNYVLYAQYLSDPNGRPAEVRFVVTDAAGHLVFSDRQTKQDEDFKRTAGADPDPMGCSVLVVERLFSRLGWQKPSGGIEAHGKFARKWAKMSGLPDDAELAAMEQRFEKLKADVNTAQVAVYATRIGDRCSGESAGRLAREIGEKLGCRTVNADKQVTAPLERSPNELKLLWELARVFRGYLQENPPDSNYALLAEYYLDAAGGPAHAVHFVVCDKSGDYVLVDLQNNQHEDFQRIDPKTVEDCDRLVVERLVKRLR